VRHLTTEAPHRGKYGRASNSSVPVSNTIIT
jgi:hypothetical protein